VSTPDLTIAIPTYARPVLLSRTLTSVISEASVDATRVEILISDNAPDISSAIVQYRLAEWHGPVLYLENRPGLGPVGNFNQCLARASGRHVLVLHDDDYLLPGGIAAILDAIGDPEHGDAILFGVEVVDERGRLRRRQRFARREYLPPPRAVRRLLTDSSFVRMPAIVFRRAIFDEVSPFDPRFGNPTDFELLLRVFGRFGVRCEAATVAAYSVHIGGSTTEMFDGKNAAIALEIFDRAKAMGLLDEGTVRRAEVAWFHQWILGGTYRHLRAGDVAGARRVMALLGLAPLRELGWARRWAPLRFLFTLLVRLPERLGGQAMRIIGRLSPERLAR
jgi:glycosyltransferase involved in cell wall biosynthesis